jgi:hypothetical protein
MAIHLTIFILLMKPVRDQYESDPGAKFLRDTYEVCFCLYHYMIVVAYTCFCLCHYVIVVAYTWFL